MKRILVLMLTVSVLFCNMLIVASAEADLIVFDNIKPDGNVDIESLADFTVSVDESITVSSVELIADGISLGVDEAAPFSFSLDDSVLGERTVEAIVCSSDGTYYNAEKTFSVVRYFEGEHRALNFNSYAGGTTSGTTLHTINSESKYASAHTAHTRGQNDKCLMVSYTDTTVAPMFRHFISSTQSKNSSIHHFETDFYFDQLEKGDAGWNSFSWYTYGKVDGTDKLQTIISVAGSDTGVFLTCGEQKFQLNQQQWYTIAFEYDWKTGNISLWIDGEEKVKDTIINEGTVRTSLSRFQSGGYIRGGSICIDNLNMWVVLSTPVGKGLSEGEQQPFTGESVTLALSSAISAVDTTELKLANEIGEVTIDSAEFSEENSTITVTPKGGFLSSNTYELIIPAKTQFKSCTIAEPLKLRFKTSPNTIDVVSGKIKKGADIRFEAQLINTQGQQKTFTLYLCSYKDGVFSELQKIPLTVASDGLKASATTPAIAKESGVLYKAFVVDENGAPITDKFYNLELN